MFILLEEWNASALGVILLMFLIPLTLVFLATQWLLKLNPNVKRFINNAKKEKPVLYAGAILVIVIISILLTYGLLSLPYLITGKGLLE
jgi:hypothetical protein